MSRAASPRKPNRRGLAAREKLLSTALELLSTGRPEAVSINLVAKEAGLSWGSVQNLFGDSDGFWSSVMEQIFTADSDLWAEPTSDTIEGRVAEVAELYRGILASPYSVAIETIRVNLPRPREVLVETHPKTAASLTKIEEAWEEAFLSFFEGLTDPSFNTQRAIEVSEVLHTSLRGLHWDLMLGTKLDIERAHRTLVASLTAYLRG